MSLFRRDVLRDEKACWVQFAGGKAIVLGKTAHELRGLRSGWHGPWTVVTLRRTSDNKVVRTAEQHVNLAAACTLTDMTVRIKVPDAQPVAPDGTPPPGMGTRGGY